MEVTSTKEANFFTAKLLKQSTRYHKLRKTFSDIYRIHSELIVKYNVGLKTLLHQYISETVYNGDLLYKYKEIVESLVFLIGSKKIIKLYNMEIIR